MPRRRRQRRLPAHDPGRWRRCRPGSWPAPRSAPSGPGTGRSSASCRAGVAGRTRCRAPRSRRPSAAAGLPRTAWRRERTASSVRGRWRPVGPPSGTTQAWRTCRAPTSGRARTGVRRDSGSSPCRAGTRLRRRASPSAGSTGGSASAAPRPHGRPMRTRRRCRRAPCWSGAARCFRSLTTSVGGLRRTPAPPLRRRAARRSRRRQARRRPRRRDANRRRRAQPGRRRDGPYRC